VAQVAVSVQLPLADQLEQVMPRFSLEDRRCINKLIGMALVCTDICNRLLTHDDSLAGEFGISDDAWSQLKTIHASSLRTFCRQYLYLTISKE
jgi:hypothetical protein